MTTRRPHDAVGDTVFKLGALTASVAAGCCHACGRDNQGLAYSSKRSGCRGAVLVICTLCMVDILTYHREHLNAQRKQL